MSNEESADVVEVGDLELEPITIGEVTEVTGANPDRTAGDDNIVWGT